MPRIQSPLALVLVLVVQSLAAGQDVALVDLPSGQQIEIQPQLDHYRIHLQARFQNAAGRTMYASVETTPLAVASGEKCTSLREFNVATNDEVWDIYLRAPLNSRANFSYTLKLGPSAVDPLKPERPRLGYLWIIERDATGRATLVADRDGAPLPVHYVIRKPIFELVGGNPTATMIDEDLSLPLKALRIGVVEDNKGVEYGLQRIR